MSDPTAPLLGRLSSGEDLSFDETSQAMDHIMAGTWREEQIALLLTGLHAKGETADEVAGAAASLRRHMTPVRSNHATLLDTCGTGGGGSTTFNISTTAAIVAAAAGVPVAKHGNRSITSKSGSADVLAELGVNIEATVPQVEACLNGAGICFCFAPLMHPAMKHVAAVRKKLGIRTIFNILGPLANPASARFQLLGAGRPELRPLLSGALARLGTDRTLIVCGEDGLGDVTLAGVTNVTEVTKDKVREFNWCPEDFGIATQPLDGIHVTSPAESAEVIHGVLAGKPGPARDIVVLNAAAALYCVGVADNPRQAASETINAIEGGAARRSLERLVTLSHTEI